MGIVIVTGSSGLIGSESVSFFCDKGYQVIGIDNDMRKYFFGEAASTRWLANLQLEKHTNFQLLEIDIRNQDKINQIFAQYNKDIELIIHTAAQPSHDWAAREPFTDFTINANGTLNLLEATRTHCPQAVFIFTSTNKVYGDHPNFLPLTEQQTRWEISQEHPYFEGIDENMSLDHCLHSLFGASKVAADILVQEYARYFGIQTGIFRGGCLTGASHSGAELHGFLSYLLKCAVTQTEYKIFGYKGKQVRDNIHSFDMVNGFYHFFLQPRSGEVYNMGGSRFSNCSLLEAISLCEEIAGNKMKTSYIDENRRGDHVWYISNVSKFKTHYPEWSLTKNIQDILLDIYQCNAQRWEHDKDV